MLETLQSGRDGFDGAAIAEARSTDDDDLQRKSYYRTDFRTMTLIRVMLRAPSFQLAVAVAAVVMMLVIMMKERVMQAVASSANRPPSSSLTTRCKTLIAVLLPPLLLQMRMTAAGIGGSLIAPSTRFR